MGAPMAWLFVYGSLKQGYPNFHANAGTRVPGHFVTVQPYPMYLANGCLPCLLPQPGQGLRVRGELYEVDAAQLHTMDVLERVGEPGGYERRVIEVQAEVLADDPGADRIRAFAYMQNPAILASGGPHPGPLAEYTPAHARLLRW